MRYKYLSSDIQTLEELKKEYHCLCLMLHLNVGGSDDEMKIFNAEYETLFECVKNIHVNKDGETYEKETDEMPEEFQWLIAELLKLDDIVIEIIGCFVWVSGNTKHHKERLKELKFKWHSKKMLVHIAGQLSPMGWRRVQHGLYSSYVHNNTGSKPQTA